MPSVLWKLTMDILNSEELWWEKNHAFLFKAILPFNHSLFKYTFLCCEITFLSTFMCTILTHCRKKHFKTLCHAYRIIINLVRIKSILKVFHTKVCASTFLRVFFKVIRHVITGGETTRYIARSTRLLEDYLEIDKAYFFSFWLADYLMKRYVFIFIPACVLQFYEDDGKLQIPDFSSYIWYKTKEEKCSWYISGRINTQ